MNKIACTVGVLTKNSAATLERCLESVKDFDEIIICDGGSTDGTLEIAKSFGAKTIAQNKDFLDDQGYIANFSGVRNQTLVAAKYDWYLFVDSDEYISPELAEEIRGIVSARSDGAFNVFRRYVFNGREIECSASYPNRSMRFFNRQSVSGFRKIVHERPMPLEGVCVEQLHGKLFVPFAVDRAQVWQRNRRYIALEVTRKDYVGIVRFISYALVELKSLIAHTVRLVRSYVFCRGTHLPFHVELSRYIYPLRLYREIWRARSKQYEPRVLFLINKWKTGGAENLLRDQMKAFEAQGIDTYFGAIYGDHVPPGISAEKAIFPNFRHLLDIVAYIRLLRSVSNLGITHVVAVLDNAMIVARIASLFAPRVTLVLMEVGMADRKPWRYKMLDIVLNFRAKAVTASSEGLREGLVSYQSIHSRKIVVVHNGIPIHNPRPVRIAHHGYTVLAVGSLRSEKGFGLLIDAFDLFLKKSQADAELVIVGGGALESALKEQVRALTCAARVHFTGVLLLSEVHDWYRRADCFVLSSISEGFGLVLVEAMSFGVPAISALSAGGRAIVEDGVSGLLIKSNDPQSLADTLVTIYEDPKLRESLRAAGYARAEEFSIDRNSASMRMILGI